MQKHLKLLALLFLLTCGAPLCFAQRTLVVVRHADKIDDSDDAALSATGEAQASRLSHVLKDLGISAIYTTQFRRTLDTAQPLADLLKLKAFSYEQNDIEGVAKNIRQKHTGEVVLVVGHRSTVPKLLKEFGASETVALESSEYDSLFILTLPPGGSPTLLHLRF